MSPSHAFQKLSKDLTYMSNNARIITHELAPVLIMQFREMSHKRLVPRCEGDPRSSCLNMKWPGASKIALGTCPFRLY